MAWPSSLRVWVGMLLVLLLAQLPGALQKCVFDEVQAQVSVVRAAQTHPDGPPSEPGIRPPAWQERRPLTSGRQTGRRGRRTRAVGDKAPPATASPQPIRIRTWIPRESDDLSDAEEGKLKAAVEEAVRTVSSLLSGRCGALVMKRAPKKITK